MNGNVNLTSESTDRVDVLLPSPTQISRTMMVASAVELAKVILLKRKRLKVRVGWESKMSSDFRAPIQFTPITVSVLPAKEL